MPAFLDSFELTFRLWQKDSNLKFQILEQRGIPLNYRQGVGIEPRNQWVSNPRGLASRGQPAFHSTGVFLRGRNSENNHDVITDSIGLLPGLLKIFRDFAAEEQATMVECRPDTYTIFKR